GALQRVHGGALPRSPATASFTERQQQATGAKAAIAQAAMRLIRQDQVIILDGGTTPLQVAQHLPPDLRATVITHSPPVALALAEKLGTAAPYIIGPISDLTHLVTERSVTDEVLAPYRALGITIVRA